MKYVVANWKMTMNLKEVQDWLERFSFRAKQSLEVIVAPSFVHLPVVAQELKAVKLSGQDVSLYEGGKHTGDIDWEQLKDFCTYCIVGHSERNEPLDVVLQKRDLCLEHGLTPIVCFADQKKIRTFFVEGTILAWEDPDNISQNGVFRPKETAIIADTIFKLKQTLPGGAPLLYGGSVNRQNIKDLVNISKLDGVLVGSASLDPMHFAELVKAYEIFES
jgi:triosephosphate isomerase